MISPVLEQHVVKDAISVVLVPIFVVLELLSYYLQCSGIC